MKHTKNADAGEHEYSIGKLAHDHMSIQTDNFPPEQRIIAATPASPE